MATIEMERQASGVCMTPDCGRSPMIARGLCVLCYQTATKVVQRKTSTWEELQRLGLCLASKKPRRGKFRAALDAAKMNGNGNQSYKSELPS